MAQGDAAGQHRTLRGAGPRGHPHGPHGHPHRRRGPRERGRPGDGGREGHARGHQLHGHPRRAASSACRSPRSGCASCNLPLMVQDNTSPLPDGLHRLHRGRARASPPASAPRDRARTIQAAVAPNAKPRDLVRPGHVFPLRARDGRRAGAHRPDRGLGGPGAPGRARRPPASSARS